jgi:hypothetical protein
MQQVPEAVLKINPVRLIQHDGKLEPLQRRLDGAIAAVEERVGGKGNLVGPIVGGGPWNRSQLVKLPLDRVLRMDKLERRAKKGCYLGPIREVRRGFQRQDVTGPGRLKGPPADGKPSILVCVAHCQQRTMGALRLPHRLEGEAGP